MEKSNETLKQVDVREHINKLFMKKGALKFEDSVDFNTLLVDPKSTEVIPNKITTTACTDIENRCVFRYM